MMIVQICVGSSCHLKGPSEIVELMQQAIEEGRNRKRILFCHGQTRRHRSQNRCRRAAIFGAAIQEPLRLDGL